MTGRTKSYPESFPRIIEKDPGWTLSPQDSDYDGPFFFTMGSGNSQSNIQQWLGNSWLPDFMSCEHESRKSQPGSRGNYHASIILVQVLNDVSVGLLGPETVARKRMVCGLLRSCLGLFLGHPRNTWNPLKRALAWEWLSMWLQWQVHTMAGSRCFIKPQRCYPNFSVFNWSGDFHALPSWLNRAEDWFSNMAASFEQMDANQAFLATVKLRVIWGLSGGKWFNRPIVHNLTSLLEMCGFCSASSASFLRKRIEAATIQPPGWRGLPRRVHVWHDGLPFFPRLAVQGHQKQKGYPPEVSQFAPEKLPIPNRKVGFQPPFSRGHVKVWEGIFHNLNRFVLWNRESLWFTRFLYWKNMVFFFNSQPWQPRTNPTTSNLEGSSTAPPYFWVLKWVPPTSSKVNFFKEFSPSIWRKLPTSFFRQEFLIFPRYRGWSFFFWMFQYQRPRLKKTFSIPPSGSQSRWADLPWRVGGSQLKVGFWVRKVDQIDFGWKFVLASLERWKPGGA